MKILNDGRCSFVKKPLLVFIANLIVVFCVQNTMADCSCSTGGGISNIGIEAIATDCPPEQLSDSYTYRYITNNIKCTGTISYVAPWGDSYITPKSLQNFWVGYGYRVLRNPSGTHMIIVNPSYRGTVAGKNMNGLSAGVYQVTPPEALNQICTSTSSQPDDQDGDGFPDCLDCADDDPTLSYDCPACFREQVALCGSTNNALNWSDHPVDGCIGICKDKNFGNCQ